MKIDIIFGLTVAFVALATTPVAAVETPREAIRAQQSLHVLKAAPVKARRTGLVQAPTFNRDVDALVMIRLQNNWESDSEPDYITFGQAFAPGVLKPENMIAVRYGETILPAQIDVKALHDDGSVRHAAVTISTPGVEAGDDIQGALIKEAPGVNQDFNATALISKNFEMSASLRFYYADETTSDFIVDVRKLALSSLEEGAVDIWLDGPLVKEFRIEKSAAPHLLLRFDIRVYRDGDIKTDVIASNEKTFSPGQRESVYDVTIGTKDGSVFSEKKVGHYRASTWRRSFWTGSQPLLFVVNDIETFIDARALAPLDVSLGVAADSTARDDRLLSNLPLLSPALIKQNMRAPGGRADIGIYTQWAATYLVAQTEAAARVMFANADAAGAVPWHFIDESTGAPVRIDQRRKFWADPRGLEKKYASDQPHKDIFSSSDGGWTPDQAHKPALTFVPYLVTAERYYADELAMQAAWSVFGKWPHLREGGLKVLDVQQVRGSAWTLRDLSDAAFILPDNHPLKEYFHTALNENLEAMVEKYIVRRAMSEANELEGYFEELIEREPERISPWQNDFLVLALWLEARRGDGRSEKLLRWADNFQSGRFLEADFDPMRGTSYALAAKAAISQRPYGRWSEVAERSYGGDRGSKLLQMEGYPDLASGYVSSAYASLTAIASQTGSLSAYEAFGWLARESKNYVLWDAEVHGSVQKENRFLFRLRLPGGDYVSRKDLGRRKGGEGPDILLGGGGGDGLDGGASGDIIFGFKGDDELRGGPGSDVLYGGRGDDHLEGAAGNDHLIGGDGVDVLVGGEGRDVFAYLRGPYADDRIKDFNPEIDVIGLSDYAPIPVEKALSHVHDTPAGAMLELGNEGSILFSGVKKSALSAANFSWIQ